jgi:tetratricopeptide (TPR) repeat protein
MTATFNTRLSVLPAILFLFTVRSLLAQITPAQRLTQAFVLEKDGKPALAIAQLRPLLDSSALDTLSIGKAWNVMGLAYQDQGEFSLSRQAYEESLRILENSPDVRSYAMALNDFGGLYLAVGQSDIADKMRRKALALYEKAGDHSGISRALTDLRRLRLAKTQ